MENTNKTFWDEFYKNTTNIDHNSSFSSFVYDNYIQKYNNSNIYLKIGDLGAGNCRDSQFFSSKNNYCYAIDLNGINNFPTNTCNLILDDVEKVLQHHIVKTLFDIVYMRWFLHAMPYEKSKRVLTYSLANLKPGGLVCIEVRSINDKKLIKDSVYDKTDRSYTTTHKRWPYDKNMIFDFAKQNNLDIAFFEEGHFSPNKLTETDNPLLIRAVLKKKILPYYEKSKNYKLFKAIVPKFTKKTLESYQHMDIMNSLLESHNIKYVALAGTQLGLNRHGGIIPWDNDIDIGFVESEWNKLLKIKKQIEIKNLKHRKDCEEHCHFGHIDCFKLTLKDNFYSGVAGTYCHIEEYKHSYKQIFGYTYVYAPLCCDKSLSHRYGSSYFIEGDVNDNFHYKNDAIPRFKLEINDLSFQTKS
jgi:hypothetical protein